MSVYKIMVPGQNASSQELHNFGVGTGAGHKGNEKCIISYLMFTLFEVTYVKHLPKRQFK